MGTKLEPFLKSIVKVSLKVQIAKLVHKCKHMYIMKIITKMLRLNTFKIFAEQD